MTYIYKIVNQTNNKLYVGKTVNPQKRWYKHCYLARKGENKKHLYVAMRKYGIENFRMDIIEECDDENANKRESYWIKFYNTTDKHIGYNHTFGGEGGDTWSLNTHKEQTSKLLSEKFKGRIVSEETRKRMSEARKGIVLSQESRIKISEILKRKYASGELKKNPPPHYDRTGCKHRDESKQKMSLYRKGKKYEDVYGENAKSMKEFHRQCWTGVGNPNFKAVDMAKVCNLLKNGYTVKDIANMFNVTSATIWDKCKKHFGKTPSQIKEEK